MIVAAKLNGELRIAQLLRKKKRRQNETGIAKKEEKEKCIERFSGNSMDVGAKNFLSLLGPLRCVTSPPPLLSSSYRCSTVSFPITFNGFHSLTHSLTGPTGEKYYENKHRFPFCYFGLIVSAFFCPL